MPESEFVPGIFSLVARALITRKANISRRHFYNFIKKEDGMKDKISPSYWPQDHLIKNNNNKKKLLIFFLLAATFLYG